MIDLCLVFQNLVPTLPTMQGLRFFCPHFHRGGLNNWFNHSIRVKPLCVELGNLLLSSSLGIAFKNTVAESNSKSCPPGN